MIFFSLVLDFLHKEVSLLSYLGMLGIIGYACCLWALSQSARAAHVPVSDHHVFARRLLGSSFGLPGNQSFDYVVIGGGTAGLTIATRLAEDPSKRIAVVEAGSFYETLNGNLSEIPIFAPSFSGKSRFDIAPFIDWGFITTPQAVRHYFTRPQCSFYGFILHIIRRSILIASIGIPKPERPLRPWKMSWWKFRPELSDLSH